jgi:tRNA(Ile)-lysidine synthase
LPQSALAMSLSLDAAMRAFEPALPLGVALSGGADSTALLMACAAKWPGQVVAMHVNHGLQAAAPAFESHCVALCAQLNVPLRVQRVAAQAAPGQSPEDAARIARYKSFSALAGMDVAQAAIQSIAIAQHADDQVETVMLALGRGAGLAGLSAMPARWVRDGLTFHRPLLRVAGAEIRHWLVEQGASWVEDPTNIDERFTRNRIRAQLMPALAAVFPHLRDTVARSAAHAAQAQTLLDEVADTDLRGVLRAADGAPQVKALQTLSRARQANALRRWLRLSHTVIPSAAQLDELLDQVAACTTRGHRIRIKVGVGLVERRGAVLAWYKP